jgi:simple sugar transport system ATP-binding protein
MDDALTAEGVTKRHPGVTANDNVSFVLKKGEIHTIVGENGAGKTTLCRILYGETKPDAGFFHVFGKPVSFRSPYDAIKLGIGMVHQNFRLIPSFTVTENIILGAETSTTFSGFSVLDHEALDKKVVELSEKFGLKVNPRERVDQLSAGEEQRVELLKALYRDVRILILDEPTSVLTTPEVTALFSSLRFMVDSGLSIIFTTHKLEEAMKVSTRITVMRNGRIIAERPAQQTNPRELANLMIGRDVVFEVRKHEKSIGAEVLKGENLAVVNDKGFRIIENLSIDVREGEILGVAGVSGNGQRELAEAITGCRPIDSGRLLLRMKGQREFTNVTNWSAGQMVSAGIAHITDEPARTGVVADFSVAENLALKRLGEFSNEFGIINEPKMIEAGRNAIQEFLIKAQSPRQILRDLSGGNVQRVVVARELTMPSLRVLMASNPTKGVDVALTEFIRSKLLDLRDRGVAILLVSEDLDEILALSDRIVVIFNGRIMGSMENENPNLERIGQMMTGSVGAKDEGRPSVEIQD